MKVYGFPLSPFVRKVVVVAKEKGVDVEIVPVNPMQPSDEFRAVSPYCKIPAIDDGGFELADSSAIAHYLEAKYPSPALLPAEPQARAKAIWFDEVADTVVMAAGGAMVFNRFVKPRFLGQDCDEDQDENEGDDTRSPLEHDDSLQLRIADNRDCVLRTAGRNHPYG